MFSNFGSTQLYDGVKGYGDFLGGNIQSLNTRHPLGIFYPKLTHGLLDV